MRQFKDQDGTVWTVGVRERQGFNYKGRFHLVMTSPGGLEGGDAEGPMEVELEDVRWNSARTAERSIVTMSEVELRRRLRSARGRSLTR